MGPSVLIQNNSRVDLFITVRVSPGDCVSDSGRWLGRPNIQLVSLLGDVFLNHKVLLLILKSL